MIDILDHPLPGAPTPAPAVYRTVRDLLDAVTRDNPGYRWGVVPSGLVNVYPVPSVLDDPVGPVKAAGTGLWRVLEEIVDISRHQLELFVEFRMVTGRRSMWICRPARCGRRSTRSSHPCPIRSGTSPVRPMPTSSPCPRSGDLTGPGDQEVPDWRLDPNWAPFSIQPAPVEFVPWYAMRTRVPGHDQPRGRESAHRARPSMATSTPNHDNDHARYLRAVGNQAAVRLSPPVPPIDPVTGGVPQAGSALVQRCGDHPCQGSCDQADDEPLLRHAVDRGAAAQDDAGRDHGVPGGPPGPPGLSPVVADVVSAGGQPLPLAVRTSFEAGFAALGLSSVGLAPPTLRRASSVSRPDDPAEAQAESLASRLSDATPRSVSVTAGPDFSRVRIHTDGHAARSAAAVHAAAYTVGQHIVFGTGSYDPDSDRGRRLLAHELTHVLQQPSGGGTISRQACAHDGTQPRCGGYRWRLIDIVTDEVINEDLDYRIVELGLRPTFGGTWATQVQTPPNLVKSGNFRGRADGLRVTSTGTLRVEVVEVKSRSTEYNGGCARASKEAAEYVRVLNALDKHVVTVSAVLAAHPELRPVGEDRQPKAAQRRALSALGVDLTQPTTRHAWNFFLSLEERLGSPFTTPFTAFRADLNADGTPGTDYVAGPPVLVDCKTKGRPGVKFRQLMFQVNGAGGVSYGCTDTSCNAKEEEKKEEAKDVRRPAAQDQRQKEAKQVRRPVAEDQRQPGEDGGEEEQPDERPPVEVPVLVLVGVGAGALTVAGLAAARRRAARIAAEKAAIALAEREAKKRAAQAAWRGAAEAAARRRASRAAAAGAGKRVAGKAVGRAVVVVEAAAAVLLLLSGEAKAEIGPGKSSLEALYEVLTRNGTPPSPEVREMIENDPVLRQLAEQAAESGDASGLQQELDRRGLEFLRDYAHELTEEDLDLLLSSAAARGAGGPPPASVEELKAAIAAERERRRTGAPPPPTATAPGGGGKSAGAHEGAGPAGGEAGEAERHPQLSPDVRKELASAPAPQQALVERLISGTAASPKVDDEAVRRLLGAVPADLTQEEADQLIGRVGPAAAGKSVDEIVEHLRKAVSEVRAGTKKEGEGAEAEAGDPMREQAPQEAEAARAEYVKLILEYIEAYRYWAEIPVGRVLITPIDKGKDLGSLKLGETVGAVIVGRLGGGPTVVRFAGTGQVAVISRRAAIITVELKVPVVLVAENGRTVTLRVGFRYVNSVLLGGRR